MAKKIHSLVLKEVEFVEIDGEFKEIAKNEKKYPLFITNHSLRRGRDLGLIDSSLITDLLKIEGNLKGKSKEEASRSAIEDLSEERMLNVIYLAFLGANPRTEYTIDDFIERYHGNYTDTVILYTKIIEATLDDSDNNFAAGLRKATKKPSSKEKK